MEKIFKCWVCGNSWSETDYPVGDKTHREGWACPACGELEQLTEDVKIIVYCKSCGEVSKKIATDGTCKDCDIAYAEYLKGLAERIEDGKISTVEN